MNTQLFSFDFSSCIKYKMGILALITLFCYNTAYSQNSKSSNYINITQIKNGDNIEIPYGEKIVIYGKESTKINIINIKVLYNNKEEDVIPDVNNNQWSAIVGPFPIRTKVIFSIKMSVDISSSEKDSITKYLSSSIKKGMNDFVDIGKEMNRTELGEFLSRYILTDNSNRWINYKTTDGNPFMNFIIKSMKESIMNFTPKEINNIYNNNISINDKVNIFTEKIYIDKVSISTVNSSFETSGIQSYIGVDLGLAYISKLSTTPFFITLSPYLIKTDPEKDYKISKQNILHYITPTLGFGIGSDTKKNSPIYFAGVGVRLNKIARIAIGGTYYHMSSEKNYTWSLGFNASVNVNYISSLLGLITSAQANIK